MTEVQSENYSYLCYPKGELRCRRIAEMNERKIIHIDMDAFYASVEQRDHPELRGKPYTHEIFRVPDGKRIYTLPSVREQKSIADTDVSPFDVTENKQGILLAVDIAKAIKQRIREELSLVASAGVSYNKFLAKIASDFRKPDGLCTIHPDQAIDFIARLPIESFWGVGPVTARKMHLLGIRNGLQLRECSSEMLVRQFGKVGLLYYDFARGVG